IKEAMRLYPPAYMTGRKTLRPLDLGGYQFPSGTTLVISPYTLHRRAEYFPDPERFDPERFTPEREAQLSRGAYVPFGAGPRVCIGNHFALMEAQVILATLAQYVSFELAPGQQVVPEPLITLRPRGGLRMIVRRE